MQPLLIFPTEAEAVPLRRICPEAHIEICGVGMAETARYLSRRLSRGIEEDFVVLCGIAGSYGRFEVGSVVEVAFERVAGIPPQFAVTYPSTFHIGALPQAVGKTVCRSGAEADGADVENMEGATFFALCAEFDVACAEIRAISNKVGDSRSEWNIPLATEQLATTLKSLFYR